MSKGRSTGRPSVTSSTCPRVVLRGDVYPMESLQACTHPKAADARLTVYPDSGHDVWSRTYDMTAGYDIYNWMLSHTK